MNIPRVRIAHLPTPIELLTGLSTYLRGPSIFVKRDDLTGVGFGGNKIRKLELLLAEAQANGAKTLITTGAVQSNHCRQTAAVAAKYGLACILVLAGAKPVNSSGNYALDQLFGAEIIWTDRESRDVKLKQVFDQAWADGKRPFLIPYGGSSPVGAAAYAIAMQELAEQDIKPDWIVFASSSGGTQAGMVVGAEMTGFLGKILGISVDEPALILRTKVADLANQLCERQNLPYTFRSDQILVNDDFIGPGYGVFTELEKSAIHLFAQKAAILLDPVYTGRAAGGLIELIRTGIIKQDETVLFWHTGGLPALFADPYIHQLF